MESPSAATVRSPGHRDRFSSRQHGTTQSASSTSLPAGSVAAAGLGQPLLRGHARGALQREQAGTGSGNGAGELRDCSASALGDAEPSCRTAAEVTPRTPNSDVPVPPQQSVHSRAARGALTSEKDAGKV